MILIRFTLMVLALFMCQACTALAQVAPAWRPFREVISNPATAGGPPVYEFIEEHPAAGIPPEAISDVQLDALSASCCDPFDLSTRAGPVYIEAPFGDPVLAPLADTEVWGWTLLPNDVIWHSYWAGAKEPRISGTAFEELNSDISLFEVTLGGRSSVLRYGTVQNGRPQGWELQLEGAGMLRLNLDQNWDLEAVDFRFGMPLIYGRGNTQWKFSYYHLSSHLGDEFLVRNPAAMRINFSRDVLVLGYSFFPRPALRLYGEAGWAFYADEGTDPWEFQFGVDFAQPGPTGCEGTPFVAINGHLRQEVDFGGNFVAQAGWLWRGESGKVLRTGLHYFNGKSNQFEFFNNFEQQIGIGLWHEY